MKRAAFVLLLLPSAAMAETKVTLRDAMARAMAKNPSAQAAEAQILRAEALVKQARSASYPQLNLNATYTRLDADRELGGRVFAAANQFNANLQLVLPLFAPRAWAQWRRAEDQEAVVRAAVGDVKRQLALVVGRAYLSVIAQKRVIEASERARDTAKAHFEFARTRSVSPSARRALSTPPTIPGWARHRSSVTPSTRPRRGPTSSSAKRASAPPSAR
jgi:outer membrane protein TolC